MPNAYIRPYVNKGTFVAGEGPTPCDLLFIGEGPGVEEDKYGRPFIGKSGKEFTRYLWQSCQRTRTSVYVTNLVKYRVPEDNDPSAADIERDAGILLKELAAVKPDVIVTLGRWSSRRFLGDVDMETVHGIPRLMADGVCVVPIYHPAAGLHSTEFQGLIAWDFEQLGKLLRGEDVQWAAEDEITKPEYKEIGPRDVLDVPGAAVDTEGSAAKPWCLSFSNQPGWALCSRNPRMKFREGIILHNALHDIGVLRSLGVEYDRFDDTMIMAYLLCVEPQGLKALAKRHCGMEMNDYSELVAPANKRHAEDYLRKVVSWLNRRSNNECDESSTTPTRSRKRTSAKGGRKSSRTASQGRSSRR